MTTEEMNRVIKFRAWDEKLKQMEVVDKISFNSGYIELDNNSSDIRRPNKNLMQYTGLKDKNGKEIYEGDYIALTENHNHYGKGFVTFKRGCFFINDMVLCDIDSESLDSLVVGNIHENPELINQIEK